MEDLEINKGVELLLRSKKKQKPRLSFAYDGAVQFFSREIRLKFDFSLSVKRK